MSNFPRKIAMRARINQLETRVLKHDLLLESIWEHFDKQERRDIEKLAQEKAAERGIETE